MDRAESNWDVEVDVENLSLLSLVVHIVKRYNLLIELEEVDFVGASYIILCLLLLGTVHHLYTSLRKIIGHGKLTVSIKGDVLSCSFAFLALNVFTKGIDVAQSIWISLTVLTRDDLLEQKFVDLDITIVHDEILSQEVF